MITKNLISKGFETINGKELLHVVGSAETMDRDGDILLIAGADLEPYKKNPLVFWMHDNRSLPIGRTERVEIQGKELHFWIEFKTGKEHIDEIKEYISEGFLNAVSIGFIIRKSNRRSPNEDERAKGFTQVREITEWELLEISVVTIQANYGALVKAFGEPEMLEMKKDLTELKQFMESMMEDKKDGTPEKDEKAGSVLSKANLKDVNTIKEACERILSRSSKGDEEPEKEVNIEDIVEKTMTAVMMKFLKDEPEVKRYTIEDYKKQLVEN